MRFEWKWSEKKDQIDKEEDLKELLERIMFHIEQAQKQMNELQKELNK
jgi:hypothetical protein